MLYKKNYTDKLDMQLFKKPTSEYRGTPFWAWNCELDKDTLTEQIEYLKEMGFGGYHIHSRSGMATEYLSDDFMDLVKICVDKGISENMLTWLYDEDRWPSGAAGGYVTKNPKYRQKYLHFTREKDYDAVDREKGFKEGLTYCIACFDIELNENGELANYSFINADDEGKNIKWYAYVKVADKSGWYNDQTYVDTLSKEAIDEFIQITHETYKNKVGDEFGKSIPAIFADEPNFFTKQFFTKAKEGKEISIPWTTDLNETYLKEYGIDLIEHLPEIFWELSTGQPSQVRYFYHDHLCQRFTEAFMDNCGAWCKKNGISFTGHVLEEWKLASQTSVLGEAMRAYRSMGIPGIDMLFDNTEFNTAKQTQSVVHQYGREAMLSELYGVTNWDFDFRDHKFQGDWQAALGVTVRVPHLSWVSMKGSAKRDFPASINYQSPWYNEYPYIEDHFARLNTALTRGKPIVKVGMIHPVESCWIHYGPADATSDIINELEDNFDNITKWMLFGLIDFDFISESLLPSQCGEISDKLKVGEMSYSTIIVPGCETIRRTTFEILKKYKNNGGKIVFVGACPKYIDAKVTDEVKELYNISKKSEMNRNSLMNAIKDDRFMEIKNDKGESTDNLIHSLREDKDVLWLFLAHAKKDECRDIAKDEKLTIRLKGKFTPVLYDTIQGTFEKMNFAYENGDTFITTTIYSFDSLLIQLREADEKACLKEMAPLYEVVEKIDFKDKVEYSLDEPNVFLLDMAEYKLDNGEFMPTEELLRLDTKCRRVLNYPAADGREAQPWVLKEESTPHFVTLRFEIESEIDDDNVMLAIEEVEAIELNGSSVEIKQDGYYVDKAIRKLRLPAIKKGKNVLILTVRITKCTGIEYCYLLGNFNVTVAGAKKTITAPSKTIGFDSITNQGLPFYGGNIKYKTEIDVAFDCSLEIFVGHYRASLIKVVIDGTIFEKIVLPPYTTTIDGIKKGRHTVEFIAYGNRVNTFGSMHNYSNSNWYGPSHWYADDRDGWCYEYRLKDTGIISSPNIIICKKA